MKKIITLILFFTVVSLSAETIIYDKQDVWGTWTIKGSPYIIKGEAIVPAGKKLVIKPGVVVQFTTGSNRDYDESNFNVGFLRVKGTLIAKGKKGKMIRFTRRSNSGNWGNIVFTAGSKGNVLKYCKVEYSWYMRSVSGSDNATGGLSFLAADGLVENCVIALNGWTGINCKNGSKPTIKNCVIYKNKYGLECNTGSNAIVINTIFWGNETAFYLNGDSKPSFEYCLIQDVTLPNEAINNGYNVFRQNPQFYDPAGENYAVTKNSPAYKKGKGGANIGLR
jgi:hypothetical protein